MGEGVLAHQTTHTAASSECRGEKLVGVSIEEDSQSALWAPTNPDFQNLSKMIIGTSVLGIETTVLAVFIPAVNAGNKVLGRKRWKTHHSCWELDKEYGLGHHDQGRPD